MAVTSWSTETPHMYGTRTTLEPLAPKHFEALYVVAQPVEIWQWWHFNPATSRTHFEQWFEAALALDASGEVLRFATIDAQTGAPVGSTSFLTLSEVDRSIEIGWTWLTPSAWGTGINTDAKYLQLMYAFEKLGCQRVEFDTDEQNTRSRRALEALPAQFEGVLRHNVRLPDGTKRSSAYYSVLEEEWPQVKGALRLRLGNET
ncbi:MAG: GNAT family N-acetyltransferase [Thermoleophilaceae bacterium]|nr:GNAT family N-acetyltransferase [Thermoleophilaceae bacterium]